MNMVQRWIEMTEPLRERLGVRGRGVALLALGLALGKWQLVDPIVLSSSGVTPPFFMPLLGLLALITTGIGLLMVVMGSRGERWLQSRQMNRVDYHNLSTKDVALLLAWSLPGIAFVFWFGGYVRGLGQF